MLKEIYHLKKGSAIKYNRKNENIKPFESGGETSLEFFSLKTDCSIFVVRLIKLCSIFISSLFFYSILVNCDMVFVVLLSVLKSTF